MTKIDYKAEIVDVSRKVKNIERILMGNGTIGLMRKMSDASEAIIKIKSYDHIKNWILGGAVTLLTAVCTFLLSYIWYNQFG